MPALSTCESTVIGGVLHKDLTVTVGDDLVVEVLILDRETREPVDLTLWSFGASARSADLVDLWATPNVTVDLPSSTVTIVFQSADTGLLDPGDVGVWDLQATDPATLIHTIVSGAFRVVAGVT